MVSPDGTMIAVLDRVLEYGVRPGEATFEDAVEGTRGGKVLGYEQSTLRVLSLAGLEIGAVQQVRDFAWSPDGRYLALVTGQYVGHDLPYSHGAVWIYELGARTSAKVLDQGNYVTWPAFDGNVYVWSTVTADAPKVFRLRSPDWKVERTDLKSIYFSPTGRYYFRPVGVAGRQGVFRTIDDSEWEPPGLRVASPFEPVRWHPARDVLWIRTSPRQPGPPTTVDVLYDFDDESAVEVRSRVLAWADDAQVLVRETNGLALMRANLSAVTP